MFALLDGESQLYGVDTGDFNRLMKEAGLAGFYSSAPTTTGVASLLFAAVAAILFL